MFDKNKKMQFYAVIFIYWLHLKNHNLVSYFGNVPQKKIFMYAIGCTLKESNFFYLKHFSQFATV